MEDGHITKLHDLHEHQADHPIHEQTPCPSYDQVAIHADARAAAEQRIDDMFDGARMALQAFSYEEHGIQYVGKSRQPLGDVLRQLEQARTACKGKWRIPETWTDIFGV